MISRACRDAKRRALHAVHARAGRPVSPSSCARRITSAPRSSCPAGRVSYGDRRWCEGAMAGRKHATEKREVVIDSRLMGAQLAGEVFPLIIAGLQAMEIEFVV